jgi:VIT1/CCC1 family predicted Fe2+/Mn2+ transporter
MKKAIRKGFSFGLTSGVITTLGLIIGLNAASHSQLVVVGGIITIAIADSLSDALGIHLSEESGGGHTQKTVWTTTFSTAFYKFLFALTFLVPVLLFSLNTAVIISSIWGLSLLTILSYKIAKKEKLKPWKSISEHLFIAVFVMITTYYLGLWVAQVFI